MVEAWLEKKSIEATGAQPAFHDSTVAIAKYLWAMILIALCKRLG